MRVTGVTIQPSRNSTIGTTCRLCFGRTHSGVMEMSDEPPPCPGCGEPLTWVEEPMVSGVRGWFCHNEGCPYD